MNNNRAIEIIRELLGSYENCAEYMGEGCLGTDEGLVKSVHHAIEFLSGKHQPISLLSGNDAPEGWQLVPIEPTWDMRNEGREFLIDGIEKEPEKLAYFLWKTMVAASPKELEKRDTEIDQAIAARDGT